MSAGLTVAQLSGQWPGHQCAVIASRPAALRGRAPTDGLKTLTQQVHGRQGNVTVHRHVAVSAMLGARVQARRHPRTAPRPVTPTCSASSPEGAR